MIDCRDVKARLAARRGQALSAGVDADIAALVAEVERLRAEVAAERAAVVAWLNNAADAVYYDCCCGPIAACAEAIERGEHRREEEP